jgi:hypothetical protein
VNDLCLVKQLLYWICLTSWYIDLTHYTHHCCCSHTALSANNNKNGAFRTVCSEHIHVHRVDLLGAIHKFHFYFILMHNIPKVFLGNFFLGGGAGGDSAGGGPIPYAMNMYGTMYICDTVWAGSKNTNS